MPGDSGPSKEGCGWTVPPYRWDLEREIDLIEEIARVYGYNNFCETLPEKQKRAIFLWNSS